MELFGRLRLRAGKALMAGKLSKVKRKPYYNDFDSIKSIGIVWDASRPEEFTVLTKFSQKMSALKIDTEILGYFPDKKLPDQYTAVRFFTCLKRQDLDFFYKPVSTEAGRYISKRFDVLIDLNFRRVFPLEYIASLSNAKFKVGIPGAEPENSPYDLMISHKNSLSIETYLEQVLFYLEMIKSNSEKKAV
jgi:hypothetical protein